MSQIRKRVTIWALAPVLLLASAALASSVHDVFKSVTTPNRTAVGFYREDLDGSDSRTYSATPIDAQAVNGGDTTLVVVPRLGAPSRTCTVEVGLYQRIGDTYTFLCVADSQTATSTDSTDGTGYFAARPLYFALNGAHYYDVRVTAVSAGTADLKAWTIGAASTAAE